MIQKTKAVRTPGFKHFDPLRQAGLSLDHLTAMTDPRLGHLPWGQVQAFSLLPFAEHTRQDDAEFAATWYEGISCAREMLGTDRGADVQAALREIVLDPVCWEESTGLRYPARRPWTGETDYCTISEMGPVLSALNRMIETDPKDAVALERATKLVAGLRRLVVEHKERLTPAGPFPVDPPVYSFPSDVLVRGRGFAPELATGFADATLRACTIIHPLMQHHFLTGSKPALDLAKGLSNLLTGLSHFFSHKTEFQGEVHSALVAAAGLAALGRRLSKDRYVARAKSLYDYVRRNSSEFGWVPEFLQWQLAADELCDATCTADMMTCAIELIECSFPEYWVDVLRFWRNHLQQAQLEGAPWLGAVPAADAPAAPADTPQRTYRDIAPRLRGAFCGASGPSFVNLSRPRLVSARASAAGPRAMLRAWRHSMDLNRDIVTINFPVDRETPYAKVTVGYPDEGLVRIELKKTCRINLRAFPWMVTPYEGTIAGRPAALERREDYIAFPACPKGKAAVFRHEIRTKRILENITALDFYGLWRGPDMVDILPHGAGCGFRLYQRDLGGKAEPIPAPRSAPDAIAPFCEPPVSKETRLNRRKAPRA